MERRKEKCLIKHLWAVATPYIQIGGWVIVAVPVLLSAAKLISDARAFDSRLTAVEIALQQNAHQYDTLGQKLDTVINLVKRR